MDQGVSLLRELNLDFFELERDVSDQILQICYGFMFFILHSRKIKMHEALADKTTKARDRADRIKTSC